MKRKQRLAIVLASFILMVGFQNCEQTQMKAVSGSNSTSVVASQNSTQPVVPSPVSPGPTSPTVSAGPSTPPTTSAPAFCQQLISSTDQFVAKLKAPVQGTTYCLMNDLDFANWPGEWEGFLINSVVVDGLGHYLLNMKLTKSSVFGMMSNVTLKNFSLLKFSANMTTSPTQRYTSILGHAWSSQFLNLRVETDQAVTFNQPLLTEVSSTSPVATAECSVLQSFGYFQSTAAVSNFKVRIGKLAGSCSVFSLIGEAAEVSNVDVKLAGKMAIWKFEGVGVAKTMSNLILDVNMDLNDLQVTGAANSGGYACGVGRFSSETLTDANLKVIFRGTDLRLISGAYCGNNIGYSNGVRMSLPPRLTRVTADVQINHKKVKTTAGYLGGLGGFLVEMIVDASNVKVTIESDLDDTVGRSTSIGGLAATVGNGNARDFDYLTVTNTTIDSKITFRSKSNLNSSSRDAMAVGGILGYYMGSGSGFTSNSYGISLTNVRLTSLIDIQKPTVQDDGLLYFATAGAFGSSSGVTLATQNFIYSTVVQSPVGAYYLQSCINNSSYFGGVNSGERLVTAGMSDGRTQLRCANN